MPNITHNTQEHNRPEVVKQGDFDAQLCVPMTWSDDQVLAFAGSRLSSVPGEWSIRRKGKSVHIGRDQERVSCLERPGYIHLIVER